MFDITPYSANNRMNGFFDLFRDFDNFEKEFFSSGFGGFCTDIEDKGESYELQADLPGFSKDDIVIDIDDNYLTVRAERHDKKDEKDNNGNYIRRERKYGTLSRRFDLHNIRADEIKASYKDGVLKIILPKKNESIPTSRRLSIE